MADTKRPVEPLWCWLCLFGLGINIFIIEGHIRSYGLLYLELLQLYGRGPSLTGLTQTTYSLVMLFTAMPVGWMSDRYSARILAPFACYLGVAGAVLSAFAPDLEYVIIGYGILIGFCTSFMTATTVATMGRIFPYNRPLASGLAFAGGSIGSMVYPIIFRLATDQYTVRGALLLFGAIQLHYLFLSVLLRKPSLETDQHKAKKYTGKNEVYFIPRKSLDHNVQEMPECGAVNVAYDPDDFVLINGNIASGVIKTGEDTKPNSHADQFEDSPEKKKDDSQKIVESTASNRSADDPTCRRNQIAMSNQGSNHMESPEMEDGNSHLATYETVSPKDRSFFTCCNKALAAMASFKVLLTVKFLCMLNFNLIYIFSFMGFSMFMPPYAEELGVGDISISLLLTISAVANLVGRLFVGAIANLSCTDRHLLAFSFTTVMGVMNLVFPMLTFKMGVYPMLVGLMIALGFLGGGITPLNVNLIVDAVGSGHVGKGMGATNICISLGTGVPPLVFGALKTSTGSYQLVPVTTGVAFFGSAAFLLFAFIYGRLIEKHWDGKINKKSETTHL